MSGAYEDTAARVLAARTDERLVLLEGVHALKHALRFGARIDAVVSPDAVKAAQLLARVAADVTPPPAWTSLPRDTWRTLVADREPPTPVLAVASRPVVTVENVLAADGIVVVLERPRHLGNLGAVVRVAAAAGAAGVLVVGDADPWHPLAVRAAAGLQFALHTARSETLPETHRPIVALDAAGTPIGRETRLSPDTLLVVGTERDGLSAPMRARADRTLALAMRPGVSSLNLATAVAAVLYATQR